MPTHHIPERPLTPEAPGTACHDPGSQQHTTLSAIASDYHFNEVFSRQIRALGQAGDTLVISTSKNSRSLVRAVRAAHERDIPVILLAGEKSIGLSSLLTGMTSP